jgi:hypothetical protein
MDVVYSLLASQIVYYIILFLCIYEMRRIRNENKLKTILYE